MSEKFTIEHVDSNEHYTKLGIERALELSQERVFKEGDLVGNKDDTPPDVFVWKIKRILSRENVAIIYLPDGTEKRADLNKLYDPKLARQEAVKAQTEDMLKRYNPGTLN